MPAFILEGTVEEEQLDKDASSTLVKDFFEDCEGNSLKAWLRHFDRNNDQKVSFSEFCAGMALLKYSGDVSTIFRAIDQDGSGELSLEEIDAQSAAVWGEFRMWCVQSYKSARDMLLKLSGGAPTLDFDSFVKNVRKAGWKGEFEHMLFSAMDVESIGCVVESFLKWFDQDKKRQMRKEYAKEKAERSKGKRNKERANALAALQHFRAFLKQKHGSYIRAWRRVLDLDGSMSLQQPELFKACRQMGWSGDMRILWKALDKDDSGSTALEELDVKSSEQLALFQEFCNTKFGTSRELFRAFDRQQTKKLKLPDFVAACKQLGFVGDPKLIFMGLDWDAKKYIVEDDIKFLDGWKPPSYLTADASEHAAQQFKNQLVKYYRNYVKGWRQCLDKDNSNEVNWNEFQAACKRIRFGGDVAGAWRYMDDDLSGYITLKEIDSEAAHSLVDFRKWADKEFGSVRSAFEVFDQSRDNEVSFKEFRAACRAFGFRRNIKSLFDALDTDQQGLLSLDEVVFLDDWEVEDEDAEPVQIILEDPKDSTSSKKSKAAQLMEYATMGPGPGSYDLPSSFGSSSKPFTFRKRQLLVVNGKREAFVGKLPSIAAKANAAEEPSSVDFDALPGTKYLSPRKPSMSFPSTQRKSNEPITRHTRPSEVPGPGYYGAPSRPATTHSASFVPRRACTVHPQQRTFLKPLPASRVAPPMMFDNLIPAVPGTM